MKSILLFSCLVLCSFKVNEEVKITLKDLSVAEVNTIIKALSQLPYAESAGLIEKITLDARKQLQPAPAPKK